MTDDYRAEIEEPLLQPRRAQRIAADAQLLRQAKEALEEALPAIDYVADDMPGFDGVPWATVAEETRAAIAAIEERLLQE